MKKLLLAAMAVLMLSPAVMADTISDWGTVSFSSDLNPAGTITVDAFDNFGGTLILDSVQVLFSHLGTADLAGDNDDPLKTVTVHGRVIRTWQVTGLGVNQFYSKTVTTPDVALTVDNGDVGTFDPTSPDGVALPGTGYTMEVAGAVTPANKLLYIGIGTVDFTVDPLTMVNDFQFVTAASDSWQMEVQNPLLTVKAEVIYNYHEASEVPEPGAAALFALAAVGALFMRKRSV